MVYGLETLAIHHIPHIELCIYLQGKTDSSHSKEYHIMCKLSIYQLKGTAQNPKHTTSVISQSINKLIERNCGKKKKGPDPKHTTSLAIYLPKECASHCRPFVCLHSSIVHVMTGARHDINQSCVTGVSRQSLWMVPDNVSHVHHIRTK